MSVQSTIKATRDLLNNYQKLAEIKIGHVDMHQDNITYKLVNGQLCLYIIDFGLDHYVEYGAHRNALHQKHLGLNVGKILETSNIIRGQVDPVHYNMFILCFGMMHKCLSLSSDKNAHVLNDIYMKMRDGMFCLRSSELHFSKVVCGNLTGRPMDDPYVVYLMNETSNFQRCILQEYLFFYSSRTLQIIWQRVCDKVHQAVVLYGMIK